MLAQGISGGPMPFAAAPKEGVALSLRLHGCLAVDARCSIEKWPQSARFTSLLLVDSQCSHGIGWFWV